MGKPLPVSSIILRLWRTGSCRFTDVGVCEHPVVNGTIVPVRGDLEHHDSPDLEHWFHKQNHYTTIHAIIGYRDLPLADTPRFFGTVFQRRMWLKKHFRYIPFRFTLFFLYNWLIRGAWRAGIVGYVWARLRSDLRRLIEYKQMEIEILEKLPCTKYYGPGKPDERVKQYE